MIRIPSRRRDVYQLELTWPQVQALEHAAHASLYGYAPASNFNALRHAHQKLKDLRYRPTRAQLP